MRLDSIVLRACFNLLFQVHSSVYMINRWWLCVRWKVTGWTSSEVKTALQVILHHCFGLIMWFPEEKRSKSCRYWCDSFQFVQIFTYILWLRGLWRVIDEFLILYQVFVTFGFSIQWMDLSNGQFDHQDTFINCCTWTSRQTTCVVTQL